MRSGRADIHASARTTPRRIALLTLRMGRGIGRGGARGVGAATAVEDISSLLSIATVAAAPSSRGGDMTRRAGYEPPPPIRPRRVGESARRTRARAQGLCSRASEGTSNASERAARDAISNVPFGAGAPVSARKARRRDNGMRTNEPPRAARYAPRSTVHARTIRLAATPRARRTRTDRTTWDPRLKRSTTCLPSKIPRRSPPPRPARCVADPTAPSPIVIGADPRREKAPRRREWRILTTTDHPPSNAQDGDAPDLSGMDMAELQKMMVRFPSPSTRALERIRASPSDRI